MRIETIREARGLYGEPVQKMPDIDISDELGSNSRLGQPDLPSGATHDQFSSALAAEYIRTFKRQFDKVHVGGKISPQALVFGDRNPEAWGRLLATGLTEFDLLIKWLALPMRVPANA